ncbi:MAG: sulfotransferase domain-containing protein [Actinomycetota bacterium]
MAGINRLVTENPKLRKIAIPAYRLYARAALFYPPPRVLATSMPKAGTHLLSSLLANFPRMMFSGRHHAFRNFYVTEDATERAGTAGSHVIDWTKVETALASVNQGQYMTAHFSPVPELMALLEKLDYRTLVILRDPRDVVVSSSFYLAHLSRHFLNERFTSELTSNDDRLMAAIKGLPAVEGARGLPSVGSRIERYKRWIGQPHACITRFEKLVGPNGGGSAEEQRQEIMSIAAHINRPLKAQEADALAARTWSPRSSTFRRGVIGDWRNHFSDRHKDAFKEVAGEGLIELGYESDHDW